MQIAFWIVAAVTALFALAVGTLKVVRSTDGLVGIGMHWTENFSSAQIKSIGVLEIIAAVGIIVPALTGIAPLLSPIAALCWLALLIGAIVVHTRRKESAVPAIVASLLAIATAILGFTTLLG